MADNANAKTDSSLPVATDKVTYSGDADVNLQLVRLVGATGAEGSKTVVEIVDNTYGLAGDVKRVVPGTGATNLGKAEDAAHADGDVGVMLLGVRNDANAARSGTDGDYTPVSTDSAGNVNVLARGPIKSIVAQSSGLTTSTTAYTLGDQVGAQFTLAGAARASGGGGYITGVNLTDVNDIIGAYDVVIYDSSVTPASDNAAFGVSDADHRKIVDVIPLAGSFDMGANRVATAKGLRIPYVCNGGTSLYALLLCRTAHTFFAATTDLELTVYVEPS